MKSVPGERPETLPQTVYSSISTASLNPFHLTDIISECVQQLERTFIQFGIRHLSRGGRFGLVRGRAEHQHYSLPCVAKCLRRDGRRRRRTESLKASEAAELLRVYHTETVSALCKHTGGPALTKHFQHVSHMNTFSSLCSPTTPGEGGNVQIWEKRLSGGLFHFSSPQVRTEEHRLK